MLSRFHQFGKKVPLGILLGYALMAGRIGKEDILAADTEELEKMDPSEIYPRSDNAKEVLTPQRSGHFHTPNCTWYSKIVRKRPRIPRPRSEAGTTCEERRSQWRTSRRSRRFPTDRIDDAEAQTDYWSIQGDFICRHHNEPRDQLHVPKEETFPIPLKHIDVTRSNHTDLDVAQENRIDDYWNVDANRSLSES